MLWVALSGLVFSVLNGLLRVLAIHSNVYQAQFMRYATGAAIMEMDDTGLDDGSGELQRSSVSFKLPPHGASSD